MNTPVIEETAVSHSSQGDQHNAMHPLHPSQSYPNSGPARENNEIKQPEGHGKRQLNNSIETMALASQAIYSLVRMTTQEQICARLAHAVEEVLPSASVVIIGLYGSSGKPVHWAHALQRGALVSPEQIAGLLQTLAGGSVQTAAESVGVFSGGQTQPQAALYAAMSTKETLIGELQAYREDQQPFSTMDRELLSILANTAAAAIQNARLYERLQQSNQELVHAYDVTLESLARALELRDRETEGHTRRVTELCARLGTFVGLQGEALVNLKRGAQLHDIGKMGIPDGILLKTHPLTKEEWAIMRRHTEYAMEILQPIDYLKSALDIPLYHHEKWDGSGYPQGLKGETIPLPARIFSIIDVWDALISDRPYRKAWSQKRAIQYMRGQSGKHFDPYLLNRFLEMIQNDPLEGIDQEWFEPIEV